MAGAAGTHARPRLVQATTVVLLLVLALRAAHAQQVSLRLPLANCHTWLACTHHARGHGHALCHTCMHPTNSMVPCASALMSLHACMPHRAATTRPTPTHGRTTLCQTATKSTPCRQSSTAIGHCVATQVRVHGTWPCSTGFDRFAVTQITITAIALHGQPRWAMHGQLLAACGMGSGLIHVVQAALPRKSHVCIGSRDMQSPWITHHGTLMKISKQSDSPKKLIFWSPSIAPFCLNTESVIPWANLYFCFVEPTGTKGKVPFLVRCGSGGNGPGGVN